MSRNHSDSDDTRDDDAIISQSDRDAFAADAFKKISDSAAKSEVGKVKKLLGVVEMDAGIVDAAEGLWGLGVDYASKELRPKAFTIAERLAPKIGLGAYDKTIGATAAIGSTVALKAGGYFGNIWEAWTQQRKERQDVTHKISTVLDDIKGNHSVGTFRKIGINDNEVIYAHRKRLARIAETTNLSNFVDMGIKSASNLVWDLRGLGNVWHQRETMTTHELNLIMNARKPEAADQADDQNAGQMLKMGVISVMPSIAGRLSATSKYKLNKELQPYSALEMIVELDKQVSSKPDARSFSMPKSFQSPKGRREEYPLEEVLMRVCIAHSKEMSDINPDYTEIREALRDDLAAAIKPIAAAIRQGDFATLSLIRLVGEGKIIKQQGRSIASADEVIEAMTGESSRHATNDIPRHSGIEKTKHEGKLADSDKKKQAANDDEALYPRHESHAGREHQRRYAGHGHEAYRD